MGTRTPKSVVAIVNPAAGHGRSIAAWRRVQRRLSQFGIRPETCHSQRQGHATELTREAIAAGHSTIIAVGGDGTLHEIVNGMISDGTIHDDLRLCIVPAGTGMDFARNVGVRRGTQAALHRIVQGVERKVDVGLSLEGESRAFVNFAETGIGAAVVAREARYQRQLPGRASFFFAALDAIRTLENLPATISVDGARVYDGPLVSVVIANGKYFGGGMKIAPKATIDDGMLDVLVLGDFTRGELVTQIWKIYPGVHLAHSKVAWLRGTNVLVDVHAPTRLDLDGELYGGPPYRFTVLPRALTLLV